MSTEPSQQKDDSSKAPTQWYDRGWFHIFVFIALMVGVYLVWDRSDSWLYSSPQDRESRAQIGDSYGQLNTLFSGLALAALVFTLLLQQRALVLQRREFQNQIQEMAGSREELKRQNDLMETQIYAQGMTIQAKSIELKATWEMHTAIPRIKSNPTLFNRKAGIVEESIKEIEKLGTEIQTLLGITSEGVQVKKANPQQKQ